MSDGTREPIATTSSAILDGLDAAERQALLAQMRRKRFAKGEVIFHEGDPGDTLHLIVKGHVSVQVMTRQGDAALLRVLGPGEIFGEYVLITLGPRSATVTALDPVETMVLGRDDFRQLRAEHPDLDAILLDRTIREVHRLSSTLLDALYLPVRQRVLRRLVELADLYDVSDGDAVPISQADLAGLAGVTRQTTNRVLADAQDAKIIRLHRGSIEILDTAALAKRAR